jgi:hypothetical protein
MRYVALICVATAFLSHAPDASAKPGFPYDGAWNLVFVTQRGPCDSTYNFTVSVTHGMVTHPNLAKFRGRVTKGGVVHASVTVQDKRAAGAGKLTKESGRGMWNGYSGGARCSGYWTAQKSG